MTVKATTARPVLACMNVRYSPNLGDGLLSECLESALVAAGADPATRSIDLAGRTAYGEGTALRGPAMAILERLPGPARHLAVRLPLRLQSARRWGPHYDRGLAGADAMVIGGGNLIADLDLNFPTKLDLAMRHAAARGLPAVIFGCGMGGTFTAEGVRRLRRAFLRPELRAVFLRDAASKDHWDRLMASEGAPEARVVRDPGLLSAEVHPAPPRPAGRAASAPVIGLGLMSHVAIRYHAEARMTEAGLADWYVATARALAARGARVVAFTNGSPEDVAMAAAATPALRDAGATVEQPRTPTALAARIAGLDALVAYRMHAVIAAHSHGVPALALAWDRKLLSFMVSVDRADWLADPADLAPEAAADRLIEGARAGLDEAARAAVVAETRADVERAYAALTAPRHSAS